MRRGISRSSTDKSRRSGLRRHTSQRLMSTSWRESLPSVAEAKALSRSQKPRETLILISLQHVGNRLIRTSFVLTFQCRNSHRRDRATHQQASLRRVSRSSRRALRSLFRKTHNETARIHQTLLHLLTDRSARTATFRGRQNLHDTVNQASVKSVL